MEPSPSILTWIWTILVAVLFYLIPGWALIELAWPEDDPLRWPGKIALSGGLSLALYPILLLLADLAGFRVNPVLLFLLPIAGCIGLVWKIRSRQFPGLRPAAIQWWSSADRLPDLFTGGLILLILAVRLLAIRGLEAPMWGDSYQHSLITQLLVDHGGLFASWEPYAPIVSFTYHFGFHAQVAILQWLTPLDSPQSVLIGGQLINVLAVVGMVPLALRTSGRRWAGVLALLIAGLLSSMPMAYTNWGRYTQLAGQAILPAAILIGWALLERGRLHWPTMAIGWIAFGGLALTHYRVLLIAGVFFLAYLLIWIWRPPRIPLIGRLALLGLGSFLIFLPWLIRVLRSPLVDLVASQISTSPISQSTWQEYNALDIRSLGAYLHPAIWLVTLVAAGLGIAWRKKNYWLVSLWWVLIAVFANPNWLLLPGAGLISNFAVVIAAYIPAAVLIGAAGSELVEGGRLGVLVPSLKADNHTPSSLTRRRQVAGIILLIGLAALSLGGARARLDDLDPETYALVTGSDRRAMEWIRENIPADAKFHVNQFFAFSDSVTVGSDGGWWLPMLAGRATDLPPINYGFEVGPRPDFREWTNALPAMIQELGIDDSQTLWEFAQRGITHLYLGERQGRVNHDGSQALNPDNLMNSPHFKLLYQKDQVWIFQVVGDAGSSGQQDGDFNREMSHKLAKPQMSFAQG